VDKNFQGRTKVFNTIAEKFYPRIKIFGETIFFLTGHQVQVCKIDHLKDHPVPDVYTWKCLGILAKYHPTLQKCPDHSAGRKILVSSAKVHKELYI